MIVKSRELRDALERLRSVPQGTLQLTLKRAWKPPDAELRIRSYKLGAEISMTGLQDGTEAGTLWDVDVNSAQLDELIKRWDFPNADLRVPDANDFLEIRNTPTGRTCAVRIPARQAPPDPPPTGTESAAEENQKTRYLTNLSEVLRVATARSGNLRIHAGNPTDDYVWVERFQGLTACGWPINGTPPTEEILIPQETARVITRLVEARTNIETASWKLLEKTSHGRTYELSVLGYAQLKSSQQVEQHCKARITWTAAATAVPRSLTNTRDNVFRFQSEANWLTAQLKDLKTLIAIANAAGHQQVTLKNDEKKNLLEISDNILESASFNATTKTIGNLEGSPVRVRTSDLLDIMSAMPEQARTVYLKTTPDPDGTHAEALSLTSGELTWLAKAYGALLTLSPNS